MVTPAMARPGIREDVESIQGEDTATDTPWVTIVWDDPVNLMTYVTYVFQKLFGYSTPPS
jgi:ATP-dependent Clp protease adaptor protein ClpS